MAKFSYEPDRDHFDGSGSPDPFRGLRRGPRPPVSPVGC